MKNNSTLHFVNHLNSFDFELNDKLVGTVGFAGGKWNYLGKKFDNRSDVVVYICNQYKVEPCNVTRH